MNTARSVEQYIHQLRKLSLFANIPEPEIADVLTTSHYSIVLYKASRIIGMRGDPLARLLILLEGNLSADFLDSEGRTLKVESLAAPTLVAAGLLFADENRLPVQLTAVTESVIMSISRDELIRIAQSDARIINNLLRDSGNRINFLAEKLRFLQIPTIEKKFCKFLLEQRHQQSSDTVALPYTINTLSELFGVSRPSLSRVIGIMIDQRLIARKGKLFVILDADSLSAECID